MKKLAIITMLLGCVAATAQVTNESVIIITGAGSATANANYYLFSGLPGMTNAVYTNAAGTMIEYGSGAWALGTAYVCSNNFPFTWGISGGVAPAPNGAYEVNPSLARWTQLALSYWRAPGDVVYFSGSGRNLSSGTNLNQLIVAVDGNPVFTGPWTAGAGFAWNLAGRVQWDGSNLNYAGDFNSGDSNTPTFHDFGSIAGASVGSNVWTWTVIGDTNGLTFDSAGITAARYPTNDVPQHLFVLENNLTSGNYILPSQTVTSSVSSTLGAGAGLMTWDTNYIYVSVGTNLWKRAALSSW